MSARNHMIIAFIIRLCFVIYGEYQDRTMRVKYTDVDYYVFKDASLHVWRGNSPYLRHTYRYSPFLAWIILPEAYYPGFGKVLFSLVDCLVGYLIYLLALDTSHNVSLACASLWWYNPISITVSTRGNAEALVICLVLITVYFIKKRLCIIAGLFYALAIHLKLYPIIYAPALYWYLHADRCGWKEYWFYPNQLRLRLVITTVVTLTLVTLSAYVLYGNEFLQNAVLYHITRSDTRHNFSVFFYLLYLTDGVSKLPSLVTFLPQALLMVTCAVKLHRQLVFVTFLQTYLFVTFNKVCTSQYFLWYISLLLPLLPKLRGSWKEGLVMAFLWYFAQGAWLWPAYFLEFEGKNTFLLIWAESLAFFCANVGIAARIVRKYDAPVSMIERKRM